MYLPVLAFGTISGESDWLNLIIINIYYIFQVKKVLCGCGLNNMFGILYTAEIS